MDFHEDDPRQPFDAAAYMNGFMAIVTGIVLTPACCCLGADGLRLSSATGSPLMWFSAPIVLVGSHVWAWRRLRKFDRVPVGALIVGIVLAALEALVLFGVFLVLCWNVDQPIHPWAPGLFILIPLIVAPALSLLYHILAFIKRHDIDAAYVPRGFPIRPATPPPGE